MRVDSKSEVWVYGMATDLRAGIDGLVGIVEHEMQAHPDNGDYYLFINEKADRIKVLRYQNEGWELYYKRLDRGTGWFYLGDSITVKEMNLLLT